MNTFTLNSFIKNLFPTPTPNYSEEDFESEGAWVCHFLDQDSSVANQYIQYRLQKSDSRKEKLEFLIESKICFQNVIDTYCHGSRSRLNEKDLEKLERYELAYKRADLAIKYYVDCKNLECIEIDSGNFSCSQIVLIFYFGLKFFNIEPRVSADIAPIAKFIHLVTGRKFKATANSEIYKKLREAPNLKGDKKLVEDLEVVKGEFARVKMNEVVKMIDNEITIARREKKTKTV